MKDLITRLDYEAALAKGKAELAKPHATEAGFIGGGWMLEVRFSNGAIFSVDVSDAPAFGGRSLASLGKPEVTAGGDGILFADGDIALNLPLLLAPFVPIEIARSRVASESGSVVSDRKAKAARANGAKGGRPRKIVAAV